VIDVEREDGVLTIRIAGEFVLADRLRTRQIGLRVYAPPGSPARRVLDIAGFAPELWI